MIDHLEDILTVRPTELSENLPGPVPTSIASYIETLGIAERPTQGDYRFRDAEPEF